MKLKFGHEHAVVLCHYSAFAEVASAALGGGDGSEPDREDITAGAVNSEQAIAMINSALSFG